MGSDKNQGQQSNHFWDRTFLTIRLYRDFRLVWLGSVTEHLGEWMENAGVLWLIYQITGLSVYLPLYLALRPFARSVPLIFFAPVGGMVADRMNRRDLVVYTLYWKAALSITLLILVHTGTVNVWYVLGLGVLGGFGTVFNHPGRHTLIPNLVKKEHLMNAITLDNTSVTASRVLGTPVAGFIIAAFGTGPLFGVRAAGCLLAALWLKMVHVPLIPPAPKRKGHWQQLFEGFQYLKTDKAMLMQVFMYFFAYFTVEGYSSFLPIFANDILKVGPKGFGFLQAAPGVGALIGLFTLASVMDFKKKELYIFFAGGVMILGVFFFALSPWFPLSILMLVLIGSMNNTFQAVNNTIIQSGVPDAIRGRVMSLREVISGLGPLSGIFVGYLAKTLGVKSSMEIVSLGFFGMLIMMAVISLPARKKVVSQE